jgi:hypothetical protein
MYEYISDGSGLDIEEVDDVLLIRLYDNGKIVVKRKAHIPSLSRALLPEMGDLDNAIKDYHSPGFIEFRKGVILYISFIHILEILPFPPSLIHNEQYMDNFFTSGYLSYYYLQVRAYNGMSSEEIPWLYRYSRDLMMFLLQWQDFFIEMELPVHLLINLSVHLPNELTRYHLCKIDKLGRRIEKILCKLEKSMSLSCSRICSESTSNETGKSGNISIDSCIPDESRCNESGNISIDSCIPDESRCNESGNISIDSCIPDESRCNESGNISIDSCIPDESRCNESGTICLDSCIPDESRCNESGTICLDSCIPDESRCNESGTICLDSCIPDESTCNESGTIYLDSCIPDESTCNESGTIYLDSCIPDESTCNESGTICLDSCIPDESTCNESGTICLDSCIPDEYLSTVKISDDMECFESSISGEYDLKICSRSFSDETTPVGCESVV